MGLLLATQNPVDVDYKALSNAGTWLIGRLQTDQDKQRLLDGLQSASGNFDRAMADKVISGLGKRVFLLHNVHAKAPVVITSRWALNFLAGPLTRTQIPALNKLSGKEKSQAPASPASTLNTSATSQAAAGAALVNRNGEESSARPAAPGGVDEYFFPGEAGEQGKVYQPGLILQAQVRYFSKQYGVNQVVRKTALLTEAPQGMPQWENLVHKEIDPATLARSPQAGFKFTPLPGWISTKKKLDDLQKDFSDWIYRTGAMTIYTNEELKLASLPGKQRRRSWPAASRLPPSRAVWNLRNARLNLTARVCPCASVSRISSSKLKSWRGRQPRDSWKWWPKAGRSLDSSVGESVVSPRG